MCVCGGLTPFLWMGAGGVVVEVADGDARPGFNAEAFLFQVLQEPLVLGQPAAYAVVGIGVKDKFRPAKAETLLPTLPQGVKAAHRFNGTFLLELPGGHFKGIENHVVAGIFGPVSHKYTALFAQLIIGLRTRQGSPTTPSHLLSQACLGNLPAPLGV